MEGSYIGKRVIKVVEKGNQAKQRSSNQQLLVINTFRFHFTESIQVVQDRWQIYQYFAISFSKTKGLIRQYFWQGIFRIPLGIFSSTIIASNLSWGVSHDMGIGICWHLHNAAILEQNSHEVSPPQKSLCLSHKNAPLDSRNCFLKMLFFTWGQEFGSSAGISSESAGQMHIFDPFWDTTDHFYFCYCPILVLLDVVGVEDLQNNSKQQQGNWNLMSKESRVVSSPNLRKS